MVYIQYVQFRRRGTDFLEMNQDSTPAVKQGSRTAAGTRKDSPEWGDSSSQHISNVAPGRLEVVLAPTYARNSVSHSPVAVAAENAAFEKHYRISELAKT